MWPWARSKIKLKYLWNSRLTLVNGKAEFEEIFKHFLSSKNYFHSAPTRLVLLNLKRIQINFSALNEPLRKRRSTHKGCLKDVNFWRSSLRFEASWFCGILDERKQIMSCQLASESHTDRKLKTSFHITSRGDSGLSCVTGRISQKRWQGLMPALRVCLAEIVFPKGVISHSRSTCRD